MDLLDYAYCEKGDTKLAVKEKANSAPAEKKASVLESAGFSAYIGPNLSGLIQTGTIYPVGRTEALALPEVRLAAEKKPGIVDLIVDGATLPEDRIKVKTPETDLYKAYKALLRA